MEELTKRQAEKDQICKELEKYRECDPEVIQSIKDQTLEAREAANRWTGKSLGSWSTANNDLTHLYISFVLMKYRYLLMMKHLKLRLICYESNSSAIFLL